MNNNNDVPMSVQAQFEMAWTRYTRLTVASIILGVVIGSGAWWFESQAEPGLVFAFCLSMAMMILYLKGFACPRCKRSLAEFRINAKPKFCPQCGTRFSDN